MLKWTNLFMFNKPLSKILRDKLGKLDKAMSKREKRKLKSTSQVNPRESVMDISLRSGKVLEEPSVG